MLAGKLFSWNRVVSLSMRCSYSSNLSHLEMAEILAVVFAQEPIGTQDRFTRQICEYFSFFTKMKEFHLEKRAVQYLTSNPMKI